MYKQSAKIQRKTTELMLAAPQVVAHRLTRMAAAGVMPTERDKAEMHRMSSEKVAAFAESWQAMWMEMARMQQQFVMALFTRSMSPWSMLSKPRMPSMLSTASHMQDATLSIMNKGLEPVHRRAVANAKRLRRGT